MSGGSRSGTQVVTQRSEPWDQQRPYLLRGFEGAQDFLNSDAPQYYPQSTVTPFTRLQGRTMQDIVNRADQGSDVLRAGQGAVQGMAGGGVPGLQNTISGGFLGADPTTSRLSSYGSGNFTGTLPGQTLSTAAAGGFGNLAGGQTLADTAGGSYLNANPHLDATYNRAANALTRNFSEGVMPSIDAAMARAGRFGSPGAHGNAVDTAQYNLGRSLTDLGTGIYGGAYGQERGLQQQAAQGLLGSQLGTSQGLLGTQLQATGQLQGAFDSERNRMLQAASQDAATRLQAAGMAPQMAQADYNDLQARMGIGGMQQGQQEAILADDIARFNFEQNRDVDRLARYMGLIGGGYGSTQQTATPTYNNRLAGGLGGALGGASLGSMFGPMGAGIGAGLGGLAGLFG